MDNIIYPALCYGKVPAFGDFIQYNASGAIVKSYDQWLREGLFFCQTTLNNGWNDVYNNSSGYHLIYYPKETDTFLVGTFHPSFDRSQRKFPFTVSLNLDKNGSNNDILPFIPVIFDDLFEKSNNFIGTAIQGIEKQEIVPAINRMSIMSPVNLKNYKRDFTTFLGNTSLESFFQDIFGNFNNPEKYVLFKNIISILNPLRDRSPSDMALGLRFPLGKNLKQKSNLVCFWVNFCLNYLKMQDIPFNLFWTSTNVNPNDSSNFCFLFFRRPPSKIFAQLMQPEDESDFICQLEKEGRERIVGDLDTVQAQLPFSLEEKNAKLIELFH